jgi:N-acetylated-alpha-linked acidic dipeptidase
MVLRLANADVLPFQFTPLADTLSKYLKEVTKLADDIREESEERNRQIRDRVIELVSDPTQRMIVPKEDPPAPFLNFAPLQNAVSRLESSARAYDARATRPSPALDALLIRMEQSLTREEGLPGRPWYKHHIYAPGQYTGYGVKTFPAVREAIELKKWDEANRQIEILAAVINRYSEAIDRLTANG